MLTILNNISSDPDIQHLPFFAISPHFISNLYSSYYKRILPFDFAARIFLRIQHQLFYVVMSLARFNLYRLSYAFLFNSRNANVKARGGRWSWWAEVIGLAVFWTWYSAVLLGTGSWTNALQYLLISHIVTSPLHIQVRDDIGFFIYAISNRELFFSRLCCRISRVRPRIWGLSSPSLPDSCARR